MVILHNAVYAKENNLLHKTKLPIFTSPSANNTPQNNVFYHKRVSQWKEIIIFCLHGCKASQWAGNTIQ